MKALPFRRYAFTLIELLVVISIIAVLASLTFTGVQTAMVAAKKVQAKNDMAQIVTAITAYYTEYGRYPIDSTITADANAVYGAGNNNSALINVLRCVSSGTAQNTRQIQFIQPKVQTSGIGATKGCVNGNGNWYDPWGAQYIIFVDADYAGDINAAAVTSGTVQIGAGAASVGYSYFKINQTPPDPLPSSIPNNKNTFLLSWQ